MVGRSERKKGKEREKEKEKGGRASKLGRQRGKRERAEDTPLQRPLTLVEVSM